MTNTSDDYTSKVIGTAPEIDIEGSNHDGKIARDRALRFGKVTEVSGYGY